MVWVVFFDGDCAFCAQSVRLLARLDKRDRILFAPLQGRLSEQKGFDRYTQQEAGTMVVLRKEDGKYFTHSDAWLEVARALGGAWRAFLVLWMIPKSLRDWVYQWVARNRYRFLGKSDRCSLPDPEVVRRLVE
jgi:predicted DCC family thiol-disulfide oxidoreductase YuxK